MLKKVSEKINECIYWPIVCLISVLSYGYLIVTYTYGINDEVIEEYMYGTVLVKQDRVGIWIFNKIFHCFDLLPFWGEAIGLCILISAAVLWVIVIQNTCEEKFSKSVLTLSACAFVTFPYIGKSAIWRGCLAQGGIILFFSGLAAYFYQKHLEVGKKRYIIYAILVSMVALWFDKAYITTVIMGAGFVLLMFIRQNKTNWKQFLYEGIKLFAWVGTSLVITVVFIKLLQLILGVEANHYTSSYLRYSDGELLSQIIAFIPNLVKKLFYLAQTSWAGLAFFLALIGTVIIGIAEFAKEKTIGALLINVGMVFDAVLIYIVTGNLYMPERSVCHVMTLFIALFILNVIYFCRRIFDKYFIIKYIVLGMVAFCIANFTYEMSQIYFEKYLTFEKDKAILDGVMHDIYAECGYNTQKPIIFMGVPNDMTVVWPACESASVFSWGRLEVISREENSGLLYGFINDNGYKVNGVPDGTDFKEVHKLISQMSSYPSEGCIKEYNDYILVKLGDSAYEIFEMSKDEVLEECIVDNEIIYTIDEMNTENDTINMSGWGIISGENSYSGNFSIILLSKNTNIHYKLRAIEVSRKDVTNYFSDGCNYDNSGFEINTSLTSYVESGMYDVMLLLETSTGKYLVNLENEIDVVK